LKTANPTLVLDPACARFASSIQIVSHVIHRLKQSSLERVSEGNALLGTTGQDYNAVRRPNSISLLDEQALRSDLEYV
jgi:hypothetical protein